MSFLFQALYEGPLVLACLSSVYWDKNEQKHVLTAAEPRRTTKA